MCRFNLNGTQIAYELSRFNLKDTEYCPADPTCDKDFALSPFRTINGSCNNIQNPAWGTALTQFQRSLNPVYSDFMWKTRRAASGEKLPT